eukprot:g21048.t1
MRRPSAGTTSVKRFDLYGKVHDDYRIKTQSGGIISLVSMLIMAVLFLSELSSYLRADILDHIVVDTSLNQKLPILSVDCGPSKCATQSWGQRIGLNITFPHLRCDEVSVDTVDSKGENQVDIAGTLTKAPSEVVQQLNASKWAGWCWNGTNNVVDREIFLLHIGKIAGCSLVGDLSMLVGRDNIWTAQVCWEKSTKARFGKTALMLRRPKDHLLSIYHQCLQPGPLEIKALERRGIAPGQEGFNLPSFGDWAMW